MAMEVKMECLAALLIQPRLAITEAMVSSATAKASIEADRESRMIPTPGRVIWKFLAILFSEGLLEPIREIFSTLLLP